MIKKLHFISGLTISVFMVLHLFNHGYSFFGPSAHIQLMEALRLYYRNIFIESLLLLAVFLQIFSGLKLFSERRQKAKLFFEKLHIWSGLYLAFFFIFHVGAVLAGRYLLQIDTNFYFGVAGLNTFPLNLLFVPYYGLAILSFFAHIASVHRSKMKRVLFGLSVQAQSYFILTIGLLLMVFIFFGLTNGFKGIIIPQEYHIIIGK